MDLASQTQRNLVKRAYGSTMNGSLAPYHLSLGTAFSNTPDRFPSVGTVVQGDKDRITAEMGEQDVMVDTGLDYTNLSGSAQRVMRSQHLAGLSTSGVNLMLVGGALLIFAGLDFPFARPIIDKAKEIFNQPKPLLQGAAVVGGAAMVASGWGA